MSAIELFKDERDADFRLRNTFLVIGREPYHVSSVRGDCLEDCHLILHNSKDEEFCVPLHKLPLSAMTACPRGYESGYWWTRGPARNRFQGITGSSLWYIEKDGQVNSEGSSNTTCFRILKSLLSQPRSRRPGKLSAGILTKDVMIDPNNHVLIQGRIKGSYIGADMVKPFVNLSDMSLQFLKNAKLVTVDQINNRFTDLTVPKTNPCSEMPVGEFL